MSTTTALGADEYGVFKGSPRVKPVRLGIVRGHARAVELMNRMYARLPGNYFLRHMTTNEVVDSLPNVSPGSAPSRGAGEPYDIFYVAADREPVWFETVEGLSNARERMERIAKVRPGSYFVFSRTDQSIVGQTERL